MKAEPYSVCVCVCVSERRGAGKEGEREKGGERDPFPPKCEGKLPTHHFT